MRHTFPVYPRVYGVNLAAACFYSGGGGPDLGAGLGALGAANCPANCLLAAPFHAGLGASKTACFFCKKIKDLQRPRLT